MSRVGSEEVLELFFVETIADISAPTDDEINGGVRLTPWLLRDSLSTPQAGNEIDTSDMSSKQDTSAPGTRKAGPVTVGFHRDTVEGNDDAWTTLPAGTDGNLVIARFGVSGGTDDAPAAANGDRVEVWPINVISRQMTDPAVNQSQRFTVTCSVPGAIDDDATVAAGS